jgi:phage tail tape-measure protein
MANYLNISGVGAGAGASAGASAGAKAGSSLSVYGALIEVGVGLVVGKATKKSIEKKNAEFVEKLQKLNDEQKERLDKVLLENSTEMAKAKALIDFLNNEEISGLSSQTKKDRILPLIGLGVAVVLLGIVFYKLNKQNG